MGQQEKLFGDLYKELLDSGKVTSDQEEELIDVFRTAWEHGYEFGSEESAADFENDKDYIWHEGYNEGLEEGQTNVS